MKFKIQNSKFRVLKIIFDLLSSREFLIWIVGGWILYYASSMIWTKDSFANFIAGLGSNILIQAIFIVFLLTGYLNLIRSSIRTFKKNRWKFFAGGLLPLGILLFFTGFFISAATRQFEWILVGTGDIIRPKWSSEQYRVDTIDPGVKDRFLDIDIDAGKGLFRYEPKVTVQDQYSERYSVGAFPPSKIDGTYFHILNFGLAPGISITEGDEVKAKGYMALKIRRPGDSGTFDVAPLPYIFMLSLEPERIIQKGRQKASGYDIRNPTYRIRVFEGEKVIAETISKQGIQFKNLKLSLYEPDFWIQLEAVKDKGVPIIIIGILLAVASVPIFALRFLFSFLLT